MRFFESSAFTKLFVSEPGSEAVIKVAAASADAEKAASALTAVEIRSAIRRRQFAGDTTQADADEAIACLQAESQRIIEHPVSATVFSVASSLLDRQRLRALDAIQLATALLASAALRPHDELQFICSDERLNAAASAEGLAVWDPAKA